MWRRHSLPCPSLCSERFDNEEAKRATGNPTDRKWRLRLCKELQSLVKRFREADATKRERNCRTQ